MRQAMLYWVRECNVDGYRIDQAYAVPQEFYDITFAALKKIKPLFLLAETDVNHIGGIELVSKFDASYDWPGHSLGKEIAQGKKSMQAWVKHIQGIQQVYGNENIVVNFVSNHDENSWNGTLEKATEEAAHAIIALQYMSPGIPLIYSGQNTISTNDYCFLKKNSFPKVAGKTMQLLKGLGELKNNLAVLSLQNLSRGGSIHSNPANSLSEIFRE